MILGKRLLVLLIMVISTSGSFAASDVPGNAPNTAGANPHAVSLYNLGLSAYKQGSPESAIIFFKRAVDLDPDLADAQYNLGVLYQSERRLKEAVPRFKEALRVKPEDADSHYQLALALIDLNQLSEARQNLMAIAPNNSHFVDAQKKVALLDGQMANPSGTTPDAGQNTAVQSVVSAPNGAAATGATDIAAPGVNQQNLGNSSALNSTNSSATVAATTATAPTSAANPVALIDNISVQVIANGFSAPSGLTFDRNGNLYVANFVTSTIDRLSPDGKKSQFSTGINVKGPIGLICDDENNIYVANYMAGTVTRINPAGIAQIIVSGLKKPYYLAMDKTGNLFVSQQEDNTIVRISLTRNSTEAVSQSNP
jgi:hypothetical protein